MTKLNKRKLYRSDNEKMVAGIFGGLGDYFDIDPNVLRLVGLLAAALTNFIPFIVIYIIAIFVTPSDREKDRQGNKERDGSENYSRIPVYKKWWFWLIVIILLLPIVFMILGFFLFAVRTDFTIDNIKIREEGVIIERSENKTDHIRVYPSD